MERSSDKTRNGPEIVAFMIRAVLNGAGKIARSELCFCHCPLAHDRATVLDHPFRRRVENRHKRGNVMVTCGHHDKTPDLAAGFWERRYGSV